MMVLSRWETLWWYFSRFDTIHQCVRQTHKHTPNDC